MILIAQEADHRLATGWSMFAARSHGQLEAAELRQQGAQGVLQVAADGAADAAVRELPWLLRA